MKKNVTEKFETKIMLGKFWNLKKKVKFCGEKNAN